MTDYLTDFVQESEERITELNNALLTLERDPTDDDAMENIFRVAHTLKGNCGAMGLEAASDLAHAIEDLLDAVRRGDLEVTPELMDVVFDAVDELETMIDEVATDGEIETDPSATISALRDQLGDEAAGAGPTPITTPSTDEIDAVLERFDPPADAEHQAYLVRLAIAESEAVNNGQLVVDALVDAFDLIGTEPSREEIEAGAYDGQFDALFGSAVGKTAISSGLEPVEEVDEFELVDVSDRFEALEETADTAAAAESAPEPGEDISADDAADLEVDELLDEFDEFDNLDEMVEDVGDDELDAFEDMGEAGSFDDLLDEDEIELDDDLGGPAADPVDDETTGSEAEAGADAEVTDDTTSPADGDDDDVEDANAVFNELKDEVDMVGFDELQDELEELEFDEFDNDDEVDMDELLGDDVDVEDDAFLAEAEPTDEAIDDMLVDASDDSTDDESASETVDELFNDEDSAEIDELVADEDDAGAGTDDELFEDDERVDIDELVADDDGDADELVAADEDVATETSVTDETEAELETAADAEVEPVETEAGPSETDPTETDSDVDPAEGDSTAVEADSEAELEPEPEPDLEFDEETADPTPLKDESVEAGDTVEVDDTVEADDTVETGDGTSADESAVADEPDEPVEPAEPAAPADHLESSDDERSEVAAEPSAESDEPSDSIDEEAVTADSDLESPDTAVDESELGDEDEDADDDEIDDGLETDLEDDLESTPAFDDDSAETFGADADADPFADEAGDDSFADDSFADDFDTDPAFDDDTFDDDSFDEGEAAFDAEPVDDVFEDDGFDDGFGDDAEFGTESTADSSTDSTSFGDDRADTGDDEPVDDVVRRIDEPTLESPELSIPEMTERPDADQQTDEIQSVRVDVEQIDSLLTLVEGLVTSRVRLRHAVTEGATDEGANDALETELDDLEGLTTELQETVMDIRLVPLQTVANRLPRVVRDIAREQEKEVAFEMTGEDVELDRSILDRIGDPLIHLVRNAVDHGIEPPEEREAADKPLEGSVEVHADRSRDRVTITVEDDGGGLDPDRLRSEAVDADILTEDEAAALPDDEAYELMFHPGLSTAEEVTDVSGRGVGMDVVKRTIEDLEGTVAIDSEVGEGTTVTMTLPVTVAIDDILFVESGGEEFGVPTKAVQDIEPADSLETADGQPVLTDGDNAYSVIQLDETLETPRAGANGGGMVVRIRDDVRPVALHCDHVHGQQEVVVKPFEGFMSDIPGLSGATVRGRGEVVNILDVTTL